MAVDATRGLVIVSGFKDKKLHVYSLADGALVRSLGGKGSGKGQFNWYFGGLCMTPRGTVLVAESENNRLQEVNIDDGSWVRFMGEDAVPSPGYVDCSESVIAVKNSYAVALLSWRDGSLLTRFGGAGSGDGQLLNSGGCRLLADGSGVVVADSGNGRVCVFSLTGAFVRSLPAGDLPYDVVECDGGDSFVVANINDCVVTKVSTVTGALVPYGKRGRGSGRFVCPTALAVMGASGGDGVQLVVLERDSKRVQVFRC